MGQGPGIGSLAAHQRRQRAGEHIRSGQDDEHGVRVLALGEHRLSGPGRAHSGNTAVTAARCFGVSLDHVGKFSTSVVNKR